ncbi:hypothetical protein AB0K15_38165 [Amycolatopsis sp. NPDC049253]|uniref:hypothetical protein n=1 Tax=Amycolatopsis sp. NPDC049253 TaxID=3155274 RepID=UPI00341968FD
MRGSAAEGAELLAKLGGEPPYTGFGFMPEDNSRAQVAAFARDVVPRVRRLLARLASTVESPGRTNEWTEKATHPMSA